MQMAHFIIFHSVLWPTRNSFFTYIISLFSSFVRACLSFPVVENDEPHNHREKIINIQTTTTQAAATTKKR